MVTRRVASGMTLIEVMVALLLASIALLGSLALVLTSTRGGTFARNLTEASQLAQSKLEAEAARSGVNMSTPVDGIEAGSPETNLNAYGAVDTSGAGIYTRTTTWGPSNDSLRRKITVEVKWPDAIVGGKYHYVTAIRERAP